MTCHCSSIEFGTVAEVLDREHLQIIGPRNEPQHTEKASEEEEQTEGDQQEPFNNFEESCVKDSTQNGVYKCPTIYSRRLLFKNSLERKLFCTENRCRTLMSKQQQRSESAQVKERKRSI